MKTLNKHINPSTIFSKLCRFSCLRLCVKRKTEKNKNLISNNNYLKWDGIIIMPHWSIINNYYELLSTSLSLMSMLLLQYSSKVSNTCSCAMKIVSRLQHCKRPDLNFAIELFKISFPEGLATFRTQKFLWECIYINGIW